MNKSNFTPDEITNFIEAIDFPVVYRVNGAGNLEFAPVHANRKLYNRGQVWFKLCRTQINGGKAVLTRAWKCVEKSASWQLFRNSRTNEHQCFITMHEAANAFNYYFHKNGVNACMTSSAYCRWCSNTQARNFADILVSSDFFYNSQIKF